MNPDARFWIRWGCLIVMSAVSTRLLFMSLEGIAPSWLAWVGLFGVQISWYFLGIDVCKYQNKESK